MSRLRHLRLAQVLTLAFFALALSYLGWLGYGALPQPTPTPTPAPVFSGQRALALAQAQCDFGPRPTGSPANRRTGDWIITQLEAQGWQVETHEFVWNGTPVRNILAKTGPIIPGAAILVGAHYDTRPIADQDPDPARREEPILGGNDGASGVAVLLELARVLDKDRLNRPVWLAFFDAEDNGRIPGWDWIIGSTRLAEEMDELPAAMILVDMVGDADQRFPIEGNSDPQLARTLWELAADLGYGDVFVLEPGPTLIDDHVPFIRRGVPSVDIIDFDYPYWHTTADTCDKLSAISLERVGRVLEAYLEP
ncbi:MAG: M28 family peptidase [Caldilineales bacterium]|nr:M28 family peptidase [Caldilineales bacterium]